MICTSRGVGNTTWKQIREDMEQMSTKHILALHKNRPRTQLYRKLVSIFRNAHLFLILGFKLMHIQILLDRCFWIQSWGTNRQSAFLLHPCSRSHDLSGSPRGPGWETLTETDISAASASFIIKVKQRVRGPYLHLYLLCLHQGYNLHFDSNQTGPHPQRYHLLYITKKFTDLCST